MSIEARLKREQYHWLLGVRTFSTECEPNLWAQLIHWKSNPQEADTIRTKQAWIRKQVGFIRLWYWLFNLNQYAKNHYLLNAYDVLIQERDSFMPIEGISKGAIVEYLNPFIQGWYRIRDSVNSTLMTNDYSTNETSAAQNQTHSFSEGNQPDYFEPPISVEKQVSIESWMYPHLKTLGITESEGLLNRRDVKKAYLKQAILVHPDKNSSENAKEMFVNVSNAYKIIEHYFEYGAITTSFEEWCWKNFRELDDLFKNMDTTLARMDTTLARMDTTLARMDTTLARMDTTLARMDTTLARMDTRLVQLDNKSQYLDKQISILKTTVANLEINVDLLRQSFMEHYQITSRKESLPSPTAVIAYQPLFPDWYFLRIKRPSGYDTFDSKDYKTKKVLPSFVQHVRRTSSCQPSLGFFSDRSLLETEQKIQDKTFLT